MPYLARYYPNILNEYLKHFKVETISRHGWKLAAIYFRMAMQRV